MPQSLSAVYIHLIFSTKERFPYLKDEQLQRDLHAYLGEISKRLDCPPIRVRGVEDHVHLLARFGRTITQAEWIKELKRVSNGWLKTEARLRQFQWQAGYADFSVSASQLETVKRYIENQKEHHRRMSYQDEVRKFLKSIRWSGMSDTFGIERSSSRCRGRNPVESGLDILLQVYPGLKQPWALGRSRFAVFRKHFALKPVSFRTNFPQLVNSCAI
jgi:REP-associated tyrosine transposase